MTQFFESFGKYILFRAIDEKKHGINEIMKETKIPMPVLKNYLINNHEISEIDFKKFAKYFNEPEASLKVKLHQITKYKKLEGK